MTPTACSDMVAVSCELTFLALSAAEGGDGRSMGRFCSVMRGELTKGVGNVSWGLGMSAPTGSPSSSGELNVSEVALVTVLLPPGMCPAATAKLVPKPAVLVEPAFVTYWF